MSVLFQQTSEVHQRLCERGLHFYGRLCVACKAKPREKKSPCTGTNGCLLSWLLCLHSNNIYISSEPWNAFLRLLKLSGTNPLSADTHSSASLSRLIQVPRIRMICNFTPCLAHNTYSRHQRKEETERSSETVKRSGNSRSLVLMVWIGWQGSSYKTTPQVHHTDGTDKVTLKCNSGIHSSAKCYYS